MEHSFSLFDAPPDLASAIAVEIMSFHWAFGSDVDEHCDRYGQIQEAVERIIKQFNSINNQTE